MTKRLKSTTSCCAFQVRLVIKLNQVKFICQYKKQDATEKQND